jgi:hypothetical protein
LGYFTTVEKHPFTLRHCSLKLKDFPKWQKSFKAWCKHDKKRPKDSTIDLEEDVGLSKNVDRKD